MGDFEKRKYLVAREGHGTRYSAIPAETPYPVSAFPGDAVEVMAFSAEEAISIVSRGGGKRVSIPAGGMGRRFIWRGKAHYAYAPYALRDAETGEPVDDLPDGTELFTAPWEALQELADDEQFMERLARAINTASIGAEVKHPRAEAALAVFLDAFAETGE